MIRYALVDTVKGTGLVAAEGGRVVASFLPGRGKRELVGLLRRRHPDAGEAPEAEVAGAEALGRGAAGGPGDPCRVPVSLEGLPPFASKVYAALREVPAGATVTYGELARRAGSPGAARAVGRAMATNPLAPFVPCHRVVGASGALTGYSAPGGLRLKARLLREEGRARS